MEVIEFIMSALNAEASKESQEKLRQLIDQKLAHIPKAQEALAHYENNPDLYRTALENTFQQGQVDQDIEIIKAAILVLSEVKPKQAVSKYNVQAKTIYSSSLGDHQQVTNHFDIKPDDK